MNAAFDATDVSWELLDWFATYGIAIFASLFLAMLTAFGTLVIKESRP